MATEGRRCLPCPRCNRPVKAYAEPFGWVIKPGGAGRGQAYGADCNNARCEGRNEFATWQAANGKGRSLFTPFAARQRWNEWVIDATGNKE